MKEETRTLSRTRQVEHITTDGDHVTVDISEFMPRAPRSHGGIMFFSEGATMVLALHLLPTDPPTGADSADDMI